MKVLINTKAFLELLLPLQSVINDNHTVPILQNVKLEFKKGKLIATGENLEINCSNQMKLKTDDNISLCVNFTMLLAATRSISDKEVMVNISKNEIDIVHKKGNFELPTESSAEFPVIETEQFSKKAVVDSVAFKSALKVANKFILDDNMHGMGNISLSIGKKIYIRSTDRNRLFEEKIKGKGDAENILISGKASTALFALIEDSDALEIKYNKEKIFFKFDDSEVILIQQQGEFPIATFQKVLNSYKEAKEITLDMKEFITALKRVSVLSTKEKYYTVRLDIRKNNAIVSCESDAFSTRAEESIDVTFSEKKLIGYNYKYLIEILSIFEKAPQLYIDKRNCLFIKQKKKIGALSPIVLSK